jgi:hypothetical protein
MRTFIAVVICTFAAAVSGQEARPPFKVTIKDGRAVIGDPTFAIEPTQRIKPQFTGQNSFGLTVDQTLITCSPQGSIWQSIMVDGNISNPFINPENQPPKPLSPLPTGKKRLGTESKWAHNGIEVTQIIEIVASPLPKGSDPAAKRALDTCRITYILDNKDNQPRKVAFKTAIDILVAGNDGALYASPTTEPGKILNGVRLEGKSLPDYLWVLQNPNLKAPGFVATMTFKHRKGENPNKVVLSNLGVVANFQQWDVPPLMAGDSACALFWEEKVMKPGEKRTLIWGYGGGRSTDPDLEGRVQIALSGSFEPGKLFTVTAHVDDPLPDQVLALELPAGMERVEGRPMQPVASNDLGSNQVVWKGRVQRPGDYQIRVRSSTGAVQSKQVRIEANE